MLTLDRLCLQTQDCPHLGPSYDAAPSCTLPGNLRLPRIECSLAGGPRSCHTVNPHRNPSPWGLSLAPKHLLPGMTPRFLATLTAAFLVLRTGLQGWAVLPRAIPFQDRKNQRAHLHQRCCRGAEGQPGPQFSTRQRAALGTEASNGLGGMAEAGWGACGSLSLGGTKAHTGEADWSHQHGSPQGKPHSKHIPGLKCSSHRKWGLCTGNGGCVAKGQGGTKLNRDGLAFLQRTPILCNDPRTRMGPTPAPCSGVKLTDGRVMLILST